MKQSEKKTSRGIVGDLIYSMADDDEDKSLLVKLNDKAELL